MPAIISSLSPVVLNKGAGDVTLATESVGVPLGIIGNLHHHSGNIFPTLVVVPGSNPMVNISVPFKSAFDFFGLALVKLTKVHAFLSKFEDFNKVSGSEHMRLALSDGCLACGEITGFSVSVDGILMATVSIHLLSDTGMNNPLTIETDHALPSLTGSPALHTLGPVSINGSILAGAQSTNGSLNSDATVQRSDGDLYPRIAARVQGSPSLSVSNADAITMTDFLTNLGLNITPSVIAYFRSYDPANGVTTNTGGISITIAKGRIHPSGPDAAQGQVATVNLEVMGITNDGGVNPLAIATGVTVPNAT